MMQQMMSNPETMRAMIRMNPQMNDLMERNPQMARMLGVEPAAMLGRSMFDFMDDAARAEAERNLARRNRGVRERHSFRLKHVDGHDVWTEMATSPIVDDHGEVTRAAIVTHNLIRTGGEGGEDAVVAGDLDVDFEAAVTARDGLAKGVGGQDLEPEETARTAASFHARSLLRHLVGRCRAAGSQRDEGQRAVEDGAVHGVCLVRDRLTAVYCASGKRSTA